MYMIFLCRPKLFEHERKFVGPDVAETIFRNASTKDFCS